MAVCRPLVLFTDEEHATLGVCVQCTRRVGKNVIRPKQNTAKVQSEN